VNGDKRSVSYSINADGTYPFHFDNGREGTAMKFTPHVVKAVVVIVRPVVAPKA
jgi:hypothetical protein